eukprot:1739145-Rhodomonas_salina.1
MGPQCIVRVVAVGSGPLRPRPAESQPESPPSLHPSALASLCAPSSQSPNSSTSVCNGSKLRVTLG